MILTFEQDGYGICINTKLPWFESQIASALITEHLCGDAFDLKLDDDTLLTNYEFYRAIDLLLKQACITDERMLD